MTNIVVDLDDTLYLERDYVRSGFEAAGADTPGLARVAWELFEQGARGDIFDQSVRRLGIEADVDALVEAYRSHRPAVRLEPDARRFLDEVQPEGLITDGPFESQRNKLEALGLAGRFRQAVLTDEGLSPKPSHEAFERMEAALGPGRYVYIGDNPSKDFRPARELGWRTVRIRRPLGLHADVEAAPGWEADFEVDSFDSLDKAWLFSTK